MTFGISTTHHVYSSVAPEGAPDFVVFLKPFGAGAADPPFRHHPEPVQTMRALAELQVRRGAEKEFGGKVSSTDDV